MKFLYGVVTTWGAAFIGMYLFIELPLKLVNWLQENSGINGIFWCLGFVGFAPLFGIGVIIYSKLKGN